MTDPNELTFAEWLDRLINRLNRLASEKKPHWFKNTSKGPVLNQSAIAADSGISQTTIGRMLQRKHTPSFETLVALAVALDVELPDLFLEWRIKGDEARGVDDPVKELFMEAAQQLPKDQIEWLSERMRHMLAAQHIMEEEPELYKLIYSDKGGDKDRAHSR